ncbi:MAG TPA: universal stress protein, partial [Longilinea sp.]|nr:universal stress protein [Longilinea sp.]
MLDSILVPLDSSQLAECVLPHVAAVAEAFMSKIILMRVLEKNQTSATVQLFDLLNWQIKKTEASLYLEKAKSRLQRANLRIDTNVLEGLVAETITEFSQRQGVQLIIMSSHGRSGLTQWGISSITQKIILSAPTSVLIVRAHPQENRVNESPALPLYQRILVPLDGSQRAENVFPIITKLARFHKSEIHLVQVVQKPEMARQMPPTNEDIELSNRLVTRNQEEAGRYLEQV